MHLVQEDTDEHSSNCQIWELVAWSLVQNGKRGSGEKQECANEKPKLHNVRRLRGFYFIDPEEWWKSRNHRQNARKKLEVPMEAAMLWQNRTKKHLGFQETWSKESWIQQESKTQSMRALWKLMNQRESVRNQYRKIMNVTSQAKGIIRWLITF